MQFYEVIIFGNLDGEEFHEHIKVKAPSYELAEIKALILFRKYNPHSSKIKVTEINPYDDRDFDPYITLKEKGIEKEELK